MVKFTDQDIAILIAEPKILPTNFKAHFKGRLKTGHSEQDIDFKGNMGNKFRIIMRQSLFNHHDFSVILVHYPKETTQIFRLRRYNSKHQHTNFIEKNSFFDFHIHYATERYQTIGSDEDAFAETTSRFYDINTALECLLHDCSFVSGSTDDDKQQKLFTQV